MVDLPDDGYSAIVPAASAFTSTSPLSSSSDGTSMPPTQTAAQDNDMADPPDHGDATIASAAFISTSASSPSTDGTIVSPIQNAVANSPLWKLPPELRNMIYEYVVGTGWVYMDSGIPEPPVRMVSKLLRHESMPIYYQQNTFHQRQDEYKMAALDCMYRKAKFIQKQYKLEVDFYRTDMVPNWPDVLEYLKAVHGGTARVKFSVHDDMPQAVNADELLVRSMFEMVRKMKTHPWKVVEALLKEHRHVLIRLDSRWGDGN
jgi:hypothetical protein